jgi:hypothetical protein
VLVLDTSAYINGWHHHFKPSILPSVWELVGEAIRDGRVILPREVYRELCAMDDDITKWIKQFAKHVAEPSPEVQRDAGVIQGHFPNPGVRNGADPFILAEARSRGFHVVTYEGQSFSGVPTNRWHRTMPGICQHFSVPCCTLPEALERLGLKV